MAYELEKDLYLAFLRMGLPESLALRVAGGREHRFLEESDVTPELTDDQEQLKETFERIGLDEKTAREATFGRGLVNLAEDSEEECDPALVAHAHEVIRESEKILAEMQALVEARQKGKK